IRPVPPRYRARNRTTLTVVGRHARVTHRIALEPLTGGTDTILIRSSADDDATREWAVVSGNNRVRGVQRVDVGSAVARSAGAGFRTSGLSELATPRTSTAWRRFTAEPGPAAIWLTPGGDAARGVVTAASLGTDTTDPDRQVHHLKLRLQDWTAPDIGIGLP